ncbi:MAG: aminotransferase class I/II-fold pyridoxal phosphate-dependent enzyme, partial [Phycisphaerae bacterium]|nr:aminotransferase class I/II-fold pyridoxal phosphate-dependent enzyme [Phycisphaerae bacterium]
KGYYDYGIFEPIQIAATVAMQEGEPDIVQQNKLYEARRDIVVDGVRRLGWEIDCTRGTMFVWAKVSEAHLAGQGSIDFALRMMAEADVSIAPGRVFGENGEGCVRIALVENEQRLRQAIRNMDGALNKGIEAPTASKLKEKG